MKYPSINTFLLLALITTALVGCTTVPGSNISSTSFNAIYKTLDAPKPEVARIQITTDIVTKLKQKASRLPKSNSIFDEDLSSYTYRVGLGDVLSVVVWDHPELTAPFGSFNNPLEQGNVVREDGTIYYPFIGSVAVAGRTTLEIRNEMELRLATFIESPQVDVKVAGYRSQRYFVAGSVERPGTYPVTDVPTTLLEAINNAGGVAAEGDLFDVRLTRGQTSSSIPVFDMLFEGDLSSNVVMQHGDVLHISPNELRQVFILGEVTLPQTLPLTNRSMSLTQALATVGGIEEARADGKGVYVIRQAEFDGVIDVYQLDISKAWMLALGDQFVLEARDIVYVSPAPIARWNRWVSNVLPSLQGISNLDRIGEN